MTSSGIEKSVAIIRAMLTENFGEYRRLNDELPSEDNPAFALVLGAAFMKAAERRFGEHYDPAEVIEFVASARAHQVGPQSVSAENAETAIRAALGDDSAMGKLDGSTTGAAYTAMLFALVHEHGAPEKEIDSLLSSAADAAREYLLRRNR
jgi:hypothetical protein